MPTLPARSDTDGSVYPVQVDLLPYHLLKAYTWRVNNSGYVYRQTSQRVPHLKHPKCFNVYLHREIMGLSHGDRREVDHLNRDPLDNRAKNLEIVTREENMRRMTTHA